MPSVGEPPSSPPPGGWNSVDEELKYYKAQYETLESELQEFQNSSKELEAELERDIEDSEKRERQLKEKVESLGFEVNEWQVCSSPILSLLVPSRCCGVQVAFQAALH